MRRTLPILLALLTLAGGCASQDTGGKGGYEWGTLYRQDVNTVAVPVFRSASFRRGVEFALTKAVVQKVESLTPYKVVPEARADTVLEGEITDVRLGTLSEDREVAIPQEQLYVVRIDFKWRDLRSGQVLVDRKGFEQTVTFFPTLGEGEFVGSRASVERLATAVVQEMQADW